MKDVSREWQEVSSYYDPDPPNERDIEKGRFWERHDDIKSDFEWDQRDRLSVQKSIESSRKRWEGGIKPTGNDLLLLPGRVFGFVLKTRSWASLNLELLKDIKPDREGLLDLQLPSGYKEEIQSLVEWQFSKSNSKVEKEADFDIVRNKGRGVVILLHGAPGLGKTSTAGALGETAERVEAGLQKMFRLSQAWDCILLLDEADVFLAERTLQIMNRNGIVSVFLRTLGYYEGMLMLTTNRVGELDEGFRSIIHMALYYPPLDADRTYKIWDMQLRRLYQRFPDMVCNRQGIIDYGTRLFFVQNQKKPGASWNERQIRNAFQTSMALAKHRSLEVAGAPIELLVKDFEQVTTAANEFEDYPFQTRGRYEPDRARVNQLRAGYKQPQQQTNFSGYNSIYQPTTPEYGRRPHMSGSGFEEPPRTQFSSYLSPHNLSSQASPGVPSYNSSDLGISRQDNQQGCPQNVAKMHHQVPLHNYQPDNQQGQHQQATQVQQQRPQYTYQQSHAQENLAEPFPAGAGMQYRPTHAPSSSTIPRQQSSQQYLAPN